MSDIIVLNNDFKSAIQEKIKPCYRGEIKRFLDFAGNELTLESVNSYIAYLQEKSKSASTINKNISAIKNMIRKLFDNPDMTILQKFELEKALSEVKLKKENKNKNAVDNNKTIRLVDIEILINKSPARTAMIIELLHKTGLRISEAVNIKLLDCKLKNDIIVVRIDGKGGKERKIKLPESLFEKITETFQGSVYLLESRTGNKLHDRNIAKDLRRLGKKHLDKHITPHMFRHTFATNMINQTGKIQAVSEYLGHSTTAITLDMYVHEQLSDEELF